jgi:hypothetical protein
MSPSSGDFKDVPLSTDGHSRTHHPSTVLPVNSLPGSSVSSCIKVPSMSSHTSASAPSPFSEPDVSSSEIVLIRTSTELSEDTTSGRRSPSHSYKRKRDSEARFMSGSHLRDAQEKVEQKRAKIAARVPSAMAPGNLIGNARPASATITSLADLYAKLRRDSSVSRQEDTLDVIPSPKTTPTFVSGGNGRHRRIPRGHSSDSSPDPIAMSENDEETVIVKHVRPSVPHARAFLEPPTRLGPPKRLKPLSRATSGTLMPNGSPTKPVGRLSDKAPRSKPSFAVVITSPPKPATHKSARVGKHTPPAQDVPRSPNRTSGGTPVAVHADTLGEIANGKERKHPLHTPSPVPPPAPTRTVEPISGSLPEPGSRRPRRVLGVPEDSSFTSRDINVLLGTTPLPIDFSLAHTHRTVHGEGDNVDSTDEGSSLWWFHPIFEARAKADIRRTLRALLPADPAEDPPLPIGGGADGWRAEVRPRPSRARMWAERLEDWFGPGPLNRGLGRKPRRVVVSLRLVLESSPFTAPFTLVMLSQRLTITS